MPVPDEFIDQGVKPPEVTDQGVKPPEFIDQRVTPPEFIDQGVKPPTGCIEAETKTPYLEPVLSGVKFTKSTISMS